MVVRKGQMATGAVDSPRFGRWQTMDRDAEPGAHRPFPIHWTKRERKYEQKRAEWLSRSRPANQMVSN